MPITIDGSGTITGLSAGGLPDASIVTADIADAAITAAKMSGAQSGSAPIYAARAWVNFNGTGTVAIRASGNVSSITDNGTGDYTVNFTTSMPDANYSSVVTNSYGGSYAFSMSNTTSAGAVSAPTTTSMRFTTLIYNASNFSDSQYCHVAIFR